MNRKLISPIMLLLAAMIWGFAFSAQKAAESIPPFTIGAARSLLAFIFLIIIIPIFDKLNKTNQAKNLKELQDRYFPTPVFPFSSHDGYGVDSVWKLIETTVEAHEENA